MKLCERLFPLLLCVAACLTTSVTVQAEESGLYKIGRAAAYASHCGHRDLVSELQARYGGYRDFRVGRQKNDLQRYDRVRLACGDLKRDLEEFLEEVRTNDPQRSESDVVLSDTDKKTARDRIYNDIMESILSKDARWSPDNRGRLKKSITEYRSAPVHGYHHKSLAACLSWDDETESLSYLAWSGLEGRDWDATKYFAVQHCRTIRSGRDLQCTCVSVDHDDENALVLPDHILSRYERLIDAEVSDEDVRVRSSD